MPAHDSTMIFGSLLPFLGGLFALAGAVITFVNSRLNEAQTPERRANVIRWILVVASVTVFSLSVALGFLGRLISLEATFYVQSGLYALWFLIQIILFLQHAGPIHRGEIVFSGLFAALLPPAYVSHLYYRL